MSFTSTAYAWKPIERQGFQIIAARKIQNLPRTRQLILLNTFHMNRLFFSDNPGWLRDEELFPAASVNSI